MVQLTYDAVVILSYPDFWKEGFLAGWLALTIVRQSPNQIAGFFQGEEIEKFCSFSPENAVQSSLPGVCLDTKSLIRKSTALRAANSEVEIAYKDGAYVSSVLQ
jgi:hypothetical protein